MCQVMVLGFVDSDGGGVSETGYLCLPGVHRALYINGVNSSISVSDNLT